MRQYISMYLLMYTPVMRGLTDIVSNIKYAPVNSPKKYASAQRTFNPQEFYKKNIIHRTTHK